jgi:hypothetical protein
MCQLDPCVSIVSGYKAGSLLGENRRQGRGAVKARRIYGWTWRNVIVHEKKNEEAHALREERGGV